MEDRGSRYARAPSPHGKYDERFPGEITRDALKRSRDEIEREDIRRSDDRRPAFEREFRDYKNDGSKRERREADRIDFKPKELDREIEDVCKRAGELSKRALEMRRDDRRDRPGRKEDERDRRLERNFDDKRDEPFHEIPEHELKRQPQKPIFLDPAVKVKRDKAVEELTRRMVKKFFLNQLYPEKASRIREELKMAIAAEISNMFGNQDISYIELIIKFNARYSDADERKMFEEICAGFPSRYKAIKQSVEETSGVAAIEARTRDSGLKGDKLATEAQNERNKTASDTSRKENYARIMSVTVQTKRARDQGPEHPRENQNAHKEPIMPRSSDAELQGKSGGKRATQARTGKETRSPSPKRKRKSVTKSPTQDQKKTPEPDVEDGNELSVVMARALEEELQNLMDKAWKAHLAKPATPAEQYVVQRFTDDIGSDFRNALGLNVTKRILKKHNPLLIKLEFESKPELDNLKTFFKTHGCKSIKKLSASNAYMVVLKTIEDFDAMRARRDLVCGNMKVKATPCYRFTQCPPDLITPYREALARHNQQAETLDNIKNTNNNANNAVKSEAVKKPKGTVDVKPAQNKAATSQIKPNDKIGNSNEVEIKEAKVPAKPKVTDKTKLLSDTKTKPDKETRDSIQTEVKVEVKDTTKPKITDKNTAKSEIKEKVEVLSDNKSKPDKETRNSNQAEVKDPAKPKVIDENTAEAEVKETVKISSDIKNKSDKEIKNSIQTKLKEPAKPKVTEKNSTKTETVKGLSDKDTEILDKYDDNEEMNDEDILALISGGIVIDEC